MQILTFLFVVTSSAAALMSNGSDALCRSARCPPPWLAFGRSCYLWVDKRLPWKDAEYHCQMLLYPGKTAHLTSIHSKEEDEFIGRYVKKASGRSNIPGYWIGYNDDVKEGTFQWTDGSDVSYEGWDPGQPDDWQNEDCVERFDFAEKWNDSKCYAWIRFVCKI